MRVARHRAPDIQRSSCFGGKPACKRQPVSGVSTDSVSMLFAETDDQAADIGIRKNRCGSNN